ncbi:MAG: DUF6427 family protein [Flavobacterium psychrophilum]|jgi:hypothetical protein
MITSLFRKSTPLNYSLVILGMIAFAMMYFGSASLPTQKSTPIVYLIIDLALLYAALFITNFIAKKNALSKDSAYTALFYLLILWVFPSCYLSTSLLCAHFFILLSMRRLVSLHTMKHAKEKLFDASLWVFIASLFYFWSILFIVLVYISILFHTARDYRTWFLPILACITVAMIALFGTYFWNFSWLDNLQHQAQYSTTFAFDYTKLPSLLVMIYLSIAILAVFIMVLAITNKPLLQHSSYKKIVSAFVIGLGIYALAPVKSGELMLFTLSPLAIIFTSHIEAMTGKWQKELLLFALLFGSIAAFVFQL